MAPQEARRDSGQWRGSASAQNSGGEGDQGFEEEDDAGDAGEEDSEGNRQDPDQRSKHQGQEGQGPADGQQQKPGEEKDQDFHNTVSFRQNTVQWRKVSGNVLGNHGTGVGGGCTGGAIRSIQFPCCFW